MATRAMLFIDGTWLAVTGNRLAEHYGVSGRTGAPLDFGALPRACAARVAAQLESGDRIDVVRTHYFGSIATNYDPADSDAVQRRADFFDGLRRQHRYEVYRYDIDYRGGRVRRAQRTDDSGFEPREKAVDVGLATALLEMAALNAYDIAIVVCGDRDFVPALQAVRRLGKRVALVSAQGSCPWEFHDPNDASRLRDFDCLWLDDLWSEIVSAQTRPLLRVVHDSADIAGTDDAVTPTTDQPVLLPTTSEVPATDRRVVSGMVSKVHPSGYGFVRDDDGLDYYFRIADMLAPELFTRLQRFVTQVRIDVATTATRESAGRAERVEIVSGLSSYDVFDMPNFAQAMRKSQRAPYMQASETALAPAWDDDPFSPPSYRDRTGSDGAR